MESPSIVIGAPVITHEADCLHVTYPLSGEDMPLRFTLEGVPDDYRADQLSCHAAVLALLVPAMQRGADLYVDGLCHHDLIANINRYVIPLLLQCLSGLHPIRVFPRAKDWPLPNAHGAVTALSAGVDSLHAAKEYLLECEATSAEKIIRFTYHDVGSHGEGDREMALNTYHNRKKSILQLAEHLDTPISFITSNLEEFYDCRFTRTHPLRNMAAVMLLEQQYSCFLYASGLPFDRLRVEFTDDLATADTLVLSYLSTRERIYRVVGAELDRVQKTLQVLDLPFCSDFIDVCVKNTGEDEKENCGHCYKCARFLLVAEQITDLAIFSERFDLEQFRSRRSYLIGEIFRSSSRRSPDVNAKATAIFLRLNGITPSLGQWLRIMPDIARSYLPAFIKRMYQRCRGTLQTP